jgi:hypothetical protein
MMTTEWVDAIFELVTSACDPLLARIKQLETEVATLKAGGTGTKGGVVFRGAWRDGVAYPSGTTVTRQGSLWIAERTAAAGDVPGLHQSQADGDDDHRSAWRLCAKRGSDGKVPADLERRIRALEQRS